MRLPFVFFSVFSLVWIESALANGTGPAPGVNGVFGSSATCAQCHSDRPLNAPGGGVSILGLPAQWGPRQIYPLTVVVSRPGAVNYGFQFSAVVDSTNAQAGNLSSTSNRVQVVSGAGVQFAEHTMAAADGVFTLSWQAPSDPSAGDVRFDIAVCAGNGDAAATGDYIYTQRLTVPAADVPPGESMRAYQLTDFGAMSIRTVGGGDNPGVGSARILSDSGSTTPSGVAIFGLRLNNILVTESGVPASPLFQNGRIYAEVNGPVNTGIAIANPQNQPATINFSFTKSDGTDFGAGNTTIPAGGQIAKFLDQAPFNSGRGFQGTFTFTSTVPVAVVALRGLTNERSEFLITTLPVVDMSSVSGTAAVLLPHFADGGGWTTSVILINPTNNTLAGTVQFRNSAGAVVPLTASGQTNTTFPYSLPRRSSFNLATSGTATSTQSGSVRVTPAIGNVAPTAVNVFSFKPAGITVSEAGVLPFSGTAFRLYVEIMGANGDVGSIQSGLAVANSSSSPAALTLELFQANGLSSGLVTTLNIPAQGQIAKFLGEIFPSLVPPFQGLLRITTTSPGIAAVGLRGRYNERSDFLITTTPPANESGLVSSAEFDFPHIVSGGGYSTQFILFSGATGQAGTGSLKFFAQDSTPLQLRLSP